MHAARDLRGGDREVVLGAGLEDHRLAAGEHHHVGVADPVRRRDDDLVAGIEQRHEQVVERVLRAGRHQHLVGRRASCLCTRDSSAAIALRSGSDAADVGVLADALARARRARRALMCSGVSKSGSPAPKLTTSMPSALSLAAFAVTASVIDGLIGSRRDAILMRHGHGYFLYFAASAATTAAGTRPVTSPPRLATSLTSDELT